MAFSVLNNTSAQMTIGELNKNINRVGKDLSKIATAKRIRNAGDGASDYAISEKMRAHIRSLNQDIQNVQTGSSMVKTALGGMEEIVNNLRSMKELAINSANDSNSDEDRAILEKEFASRKENIDDIAITTNYNGKPLLDGTYKFRQIEKITDQYIDYRIKEIKVTPHAPVTLPPQAGNKPLEIISNGIYKLDPGFNGVITIADGVKNVEFRQTNPSTPLYNVVIVGPKSGNCNLWIDGLNIQNGKSSGSSTMRVGSVDVPTDQSIIRFQGSGNYLTVKGNNVLNMGARNDSEGEKSGCAAVINVGEGLTVVGNLASSPSLSIDVAKDVATDSAGYLYGMGAGIGTDAPSDISWSEDLDSDYYKYKDDPSIAYVTIDGGFPINIKPKDGAGIGAGAGGGKIGNIYIGDNANISVDTNNLDSRTLNDAAGIGTGYSGNYGRSVGTRESTAGDIYIGQNVSITINNRNRGEGIGVDTSDAGVATVGEIHISSSSVGTIKTGTQPFTPKAGLINSSADLAWSGSIHDVIPNSVDPKPEEPVNEIPFYIKEPVTITEKEILADDGLVIHHGPKQNQRIDVYIDDMRSSALSSGKLIDDDGNFIYPEDQQHYDSLAPDEEAQAKYYEKVKEASDKALSEVNVTNFNNAQTSIRVLDGIIDHTLDEITTIGSVVNRLEHMNENIVTAEENATASESTISDADMAKEMTSFAKNNILAQASQSMLAQANQNGSSVLSLLQ